MKDLFRKFMSAIMAGVCISIGCIVYLQVGSVPGAVLFTFGLITVVHYKYALYTGTAGFVTSWNDIWQLFAIVFIGNFVGCAITALLANYAIDGLMEKSRAVVELRTAVPYWGVLIRAVFCGFLMTTAVKFARENKWLPLIFAVPVFILAGFYHSIADAFYLISSTLGSGTVIANYALMVLGNFIGCNLYRIVPEKKE